MKLFKYIYPVFFGLILTAFTVYFLLNTFVLEQEYTPITPIMPPLETEETKEETSADEPTETKEPEEEKAPVITADSYSDGNIQISITKFREHDTDIYVADVKISSVGYLKTAFAEDTFGKNIKDETSNIAKANNAIFAVNGDFYGAQESGYVLKNGTLYRDEPMKKQEDLVIYRDGTFGFFLETEVDAMTVYESGALHLFAFGPSLLENGELTGSKSAPRGSIKKNNPRTAIGWVDDLHYVFVVCDGRTEASEGLTTTELAEFMQSIGVQDAYNLDGGGSATMYFNGEIVNKPTFDGEEFTERNVSDIVYIGY